MQSSEQLKSPACKHLLLFILSQFILALCLFTYLRPSRDRGPEPQAGNPSALTIQLGNNPTAPQAGSELIILLWTWPFGQPAALQKCSELLGIGDCHITANRSWYHKANAVIVHHRDVCSSPKQLPQGPRPPSQHWIWFNLESPSHSPNLRFMDNLFNLTMSYRRDSDIFTPYGWLEVLSQPQNFSIPAKSKLVSWVVSNWNPASRRVQYYGELKKYLHVDIYGHQHMPLPQDKLVSTLSQYKFYLAFENSLHEDYITEKLWYNALGSGAVPVVCGPPRENYERFLPPDAFIHIDDFPNAQGLAQYLQELDKDPARYQRYFQWRTWLKPSEQSSWTIRFCKACRALQMTETYQTRTGLAKWFR
ncbi:4-galactosyl-N-acetylglucosaminide 3-alpha-L-fucosyltransferase FUT6-like [Mauremys reevesii]|uniref:4-galactosyl-N-acetylglucosaminide 3-alpha-L-fucosyltransferase FUT6-like n=1 Tax=Mauremys reevesii TaxID=260615 RepID=UPI00193F8BB4|nr:4-galactosyl-N-acetylglucosaminide 3-alpha-L-fucosyltransferase FUT6-like [Mauremys reevesii]